MAAVLFSNKILIFNPGYHSLTRIYCAQQMTVSECDPRIIVSIVSGLAVRQQADALETGELVTDSQIDRGEVTADSSLPPSDIKHPAFSERDLSTVQFPVCGLRAYQCEVCNITHDIVSCAGIPRHFSSMSAVWCTGDITVAHKQERACGM